MRKIFVFICLIFWSNLTFGQLINDESYKDKSFWEFKTELEYCIVKKDLNKLRSFLASGILVAKDACSQPECSKDEFMQYFFGDGGDNEAAWNELLSVVRLGFFKTQKRDLFYTLKKSEAGYFAAPSYLNKINTDKEVIILGENVNIRQKPSLKAKVLRMVSYEKFKCDCNIVDNKPTTIQNVDGIQWLEIKLPNGETGYVSLDLTSYKIEKEITIGKINGKWKILSYYTAPGC
ncbi:SH3 domain-containing protein [Tenacibaculum sp. MEBiC06402]|uniref:SH3 domain-containing protein n=1 Tax=unclassified Tenacibaculum TaxID=2635139 RepID=UPI003B9ADC65